MGFYRSNRKVANTGYYRETYLGYYHVSVHVDIGFMFNLFV